MGPSPQVPMDDHLDSHHSHVLSEAIKNLLATELAEKTMAQLIDGLPETDVAWDTRGTFLTRAHPLMDHKEICPGVLDRTKTLRDEFDLNSLRFGLCTLEAFQDADSGTYEFKMRLVELVAVAIHSIAVALFKLEPKSHTQEHIDFVTKWNRPTGWTFILGRKRWEEPLFPPRPTHFFHCEYLDFDLYPNGLADVAGYWAEDQIFGGVFVFDRGQSGTESLDIFLHQGRNLTTFRLWRLFMSQLDSIVNLLLGKTSSADSPLPLSATDDNRYRFDPWDAIALHHIFRDPWERRIPLEKPPERDVRSAGDYPELNDLMDAIQNLDEQVDVVDCVDFNIPQEDDSHGKLNPDESNNQEIESASSIVEKSQQEQVPTGDTDLSWIIKMGGHIGEPLGRKRLPYIGPPESERKRSPSYDSDDDISVTSQRMRSPSSRALSPEDFERQIDGDEKGNISVSEDEDAERREAASKAHTTTETREDRIETETAAQ